MMNMIDFYIKVIDLEEFPVQKRIMKKYSKHELKIICLVIIIQ